MPFPVGHAPAIMDNRGHINTPSLKGLEVISDIFRIPLLKTHPQSFQSLTTFDLCDKNCYKPGRGNLTMKIERQEARKRKWESPFKRASCF